MFNYSYKRNKNILSNIFNVSHETLLKEARRLANLSKRRIKQINKRKYDSYSAEILKNEQVHLRDGVYKSNPFSIYQRLNNVDLRSIIQSYDRFLQSDDSTYQKIEFFSNDKKQKRRKNMVEKIAGRNLNTSDWAKLNYVLHNIEQSNMLVDILGSEQVIDLVLNYDLSAAEIHDNIDRYFAENQEIDIDDLFTLFGMQL